MFCQCHLPLMVLFAWTEQFPSLYTTALNINDLEHCVKNVSKFRHLNITRNLNSEKRLNFSSVWGYDFRTDAWISHLLLSHWLSVYYKHALNVCRISLFSQYLKVYRNHSVRLFPSHSHPSGFSWRGSNVLDLMASEKNRLVLVLRHYTETTTTVTQLFAQIAATFILQIHNLYNII